MVLDTNVETFQRRLFIVLLLAELRKIYGSVIEDVEITGLYPASLSVRFRLVVAALTKLDFSSGNFTEKLQNVLISPSSSMVAAFKVTSTQLTKLSPCEGICYRNADDTQCICPLTVPMASWTPLPVSAMNDTSQGVSNLGDASGSSMVSIIWVFAGVGVALLVALPVTLYCRRRNRILS